MVVTWLILFFIKIYFVIKAVDLYTLNVYIMIMEETFMKQVYPVIFTQLKDKKDTVLINVPDMDILTEGFGLSDAIEMARDAIGANGITLQDLGREIPVPSDISDIDIKNGPLTMMVLVMFRLWI